jgi:hypothetical protein
MRYPPIATLSKEQVSALVKAHAAYAMHRAYEYRATAAHPYTRRQPTMLAAAELAWLTATLWIEIERFACR